MRLGKPEDNTGAEYSELNINGITVYVHNSLSEVDKSILLEIDLQGMLFNKRLVMYGLPAESSGCCG